MDSPQGVGAGRNLSGETAQDFFFKPAVIDHHGAGFGNGGRQAFRKRPARIGPFRRQKLHVPERVGLPFLDMQGKLERNLLVGPNSVERGNGVLNRFKIQEGKRGSEGS